MLLSSRCWHQFDPAAVARFANRYTAALNLFTKAVRPGAQATAGADRSLAFAGEGLRATSLEASLFGPRVTFATPDAFYRRRAALADGRRAELSAGRPPARRRSGQLAVVRSVVMCSLACLRAEHGQRHESRTEGKRTEHDR